MNPNGTHSEQAVTRTASAVLRGIHREFGSPPAGVTCVVGPPGSGKTLILRILGSAPESELRRPSRGAVTVDDVDRLTSVSVTELAAILVRTAAASAAPVIVSATSLGPGEPVTELLRRHHARVVRIRPLRLQDVKSIAESRLGGPIAVDGAARLLHLSMGRPAILHQLVEANLSHGALRRVHGTWRLGRDLDLDLGGAELYLDGPDIADLPLTEQSAIHLVAAVDGISLDLLSALTTAGTVDSLLSRRILRPRNSPGQGSTLVEVVFRQPLLRLLVQNRLGDDHLALLRRKIRDGARTTMARPDPLRPSLNHSDLDPCYLAAGHVLIGRSKASRLLVPDDIGQRTPVPGSLSGAIMAVGSGDTDRARSYLLPAFDRLGGEPTALMSPAALWAVAYLAHVTSDAALATEIRTTCPSMQAIPPAIRSLIEAWTAPESEAGARVERVLRARDALDDAGLVAMSDFVRVDVLGSGCDPDSLPAHRRPHQSPLSEMTDEVYRAHRGHDIASLARMGGRLDECGAVLAGAILTAVAWRLALRTGSLGEAENLRCRLDLFAASCPSVDLPVFGPVTDGHGLSAREKQIVEFVRRGLSNRDIAERLTLSVRTVEGHVFRALRRLGLRTRHELGDG